MTIKRLTVQFTEEVMGIIDKVPMGNTEAEKIRNIVLAWLSDKSLISTKAKANMEKGK